MNTLTETNVRLFASAKSWIEGEALRQFYASSSLEGVRLAVGFPDLHPGKGSPVGAAFVTEGQIYPSLIGGDIGCGMALSGGLAAGGKAALLAYEIWRDKVNASGGILGRKVELMVLDNKKAQLQVGDVDLALQVVQQFTGMNVMMYYAPKVFGIAGFGSNAALWGTAVVGLTNVLATFISIALVARLGRRPASAARTSRPRPDPWWPIPRPAPRAPGRPCR